MMKDKQQTEQEAKLKALQEKPVSEEVKASIKQKQKYLNKPLNK